MTVEGGPSSEEPRAEQLHVERFDAISAVPDWGSLSETPSFYMSEPWLRANEGALRSRQTYVMVRTDLGQAVAGTIVHVIEDQSTYSYYNLPDLLISEETRRALAAQPRASRDLDLEVRRLRGLREDAYPLLTCTAPSGYSGGIAYSTAVSPDMKRQASRVLVSYLEDRRRAGEGAGLAFLYIAAGRDPFLEEALSSMGHQSFVLDAQCVLDLEWATFDGYLGARSRKRREAIRREMRRCSERGLTFHVEDAGALTSELASLQVNVQRKHGHEVTVEDVLRRYAEVTRVLGPWMRVGVLRRDDRPAAFCLYFDVGDTYYMRAFGVDDDLVDRTDFAYFNTVYYGPIRQAVAEGKKRIHFGPGSYETKVARGCRVELLLAFFRFSSPAVAGFSKVAAAYGVVQATTFARCS